MFQRFHEVKGFTYSEVLICYALVLVEYSLAEMFVIGGAAVFSGLFMVYAALCFFTLDGLEFMNVLTDGAREYGKYPIGIYGKRMLQFCTVIVPYALIQYYPLLYLLGRTTSLWNMVMPLFAVIFLIPCYVLWRVGVRHYKSSGS